MCPKYDGDIELEVARAESLFDQPVIIDQRNGELLDRDEVEEIGRPNWWLPKKVVNAAMELIRKEFPSIGDLFNCQWGKTIEYNQANSSKWIQIVHNARDHYVVATKGYTSNNLVLLYDSNWNGINDPDQHVVYCVAKIEKTTEKILNIGLMDC